MPTISDYLDWRGDIPFSFRPLNDADSYIISKIGTIDWSGIVPEDLSYLPLSSALEAYFRRGGTDYLGVAASPHIVPIVSRLPRLERFCSLGLTMFSKNLSEEITEQFSALTLCLPDGSHYVSFRGTDDTLIGWKEDFLFAVGMETAAQISAANYLQELAGKVRGRLIVGGHSKGGNLAVFAASNVPERIQKRIERIYDFDGPGFDKSFFEKPGYLAVKDKIRLIYSKNAMVGTLLQQNERALIADCNSVGAAAHDGFTWEVRADGFVPCPELTPAARAFNETMDKLLENRTPEEKQELIRSLFDALSVSGAKTLTDLTEQGIRNSIGVVHTLFKDPSIRRTVTDLLGMLVREYVSERRKERQDHRPESQ